MLHKNFQIPEDELIQRLRESVRRKRPWAWTGVIVLFVLIAVPIAFFVWLVYPEPDPPALKVVTFDGLCQQGDTHTVRARVETAEPGEKAELGGHELFFETGGKLLGKATTNARGEAEFAWTPRPGLTSVTVRFPGDKKRREQKLESHLHCWPADSRILVVDIPSLADSDAPTWRGDNFLEINARPGASKALHTARARNFQVAYLAPEIKGGPSHFKLAGWTRQAFPLSEGGFPSGPILKARSETFQTILKFTGPHVGVSAEPELARFLHAAGLPVVFLGVESPRADIPAAASWMELAGKLPGAN